MTSATATNGKTASSIQIMEFLPCRVKKGGDFSRRVVFIKYENAFYKATTDLPAEREGVHEGNIMTFDPVPIPMDHVFPIYVPSLTQAPPHIAQDSDRVFVKKPSFLSYSPSEPYQVAKWFLQEAHVLERLSTSPHPNIVECLGCIVDEGRIEGICMENCETSLQALLEDQKDRVIKIRRH